jgi:type IV pilus secretin PilQ/predicted competence protein
VAAAETPAVETPPAESPWLAVRDVRLEPVGEGRRVSVQLTRTPDDVKQFMLASPPRVVIDLTGPRVEENPRDARFPFDDPVLSRVRVAPHNGFLRVVLDLRRDVKPFSVRSDGMDVLADLGDTGAPLPALAPVVTPSETAPPDAPSSAGAGDVPAPPRQPEPRSVELPAAEPPALAAGESDAGAEVPSDPPIKVRHQGRGPLVGDGPVYRGDRVSLDFKDADVLNVLRVLADVSKLNIVATDDVQGKVTLHLNDVPWDQALDLVLRANRLEKTHEGNVIRISTVNRLREERESLRAAQDAEKELEPLRVKYLKVNYARADEELIDKVKGVLTERGSVTFDERTNTIIVRDIQRGIDDGSTLVRQLDVQSPQVLIESHIVEATEDFGRALGVQWGYRFNAGPATGNPTGSNFPGTVGIGGSGLGAGTPAPPSGAGNPTLPIPFLADFPVPPNFGGGFGPGAGSAIDMTLGSLSGAQALTARLTALEEEGKAKIVSRPRVITMNNVAATIESLQILRVRLPGTGTVISTGAGGAAGSATNATEKINTGITLVVTPQISADGYVLMNIFAKSSQADFSRTVDGIPAEISRQANSNVLIRDGETVVLGGILRSTSDDRESGLPYLRRVPAVGWLFKRMLRNRRKDEMIVFLTPRVVNAEGLPRLPSAEQLWQERNKGG